MTIHLYQCLGPYWLHLPTKGDFSKVSEVDRQRLGYPQHVHFYRTYGPEELGSKVKGFAAAAAGIAEKGYYVSRHEGRVTEA